MMKKGRSFVMDPSPSSSRYKHQALLQDYEELLRETEAKKMKLRRTTEKKLKLTAEVKFLRRKYKSFARNPSQEIPCRLKKVSRRTPLDQPQTPMKNIKGHEAPSTSAPFDLNKNAEEMEGVQAEWEQPKADKSKRCSADGGVVARGLNLSIFKDVGSGPNHVGKGKISWQDQVALRV